MKFNFPAYLKSKTTPEPKRRKKLLLFFVFFITTVLFSYVFIGFDFEISEPPTSVALKEKAGQTSLRSEATEAHWEIPRILEKSVAVSAGDTLMNLLMRGGLARSEAHAVISSMEELFNPRRFHQDHEVTLAFEAMEHEDPLFRGMSLKLDVTQKIQVTRTPENEFVAQKIVYELQTRPVRAEGEISSSLYSAAVNSGVPVEVLMQLIRAYSFDIDFQRDIQPGNRFEILFEELIDDQGNRVRGGAMLFARLNIGGRDLAVFRYETSDGEVDFFNEKGRSVRRALMLTPIDGARISSSFGMRKHPILGFNRKHQGLDFAAPTGTQIMAAGDGVVEFVGPKGDFGNYIRLRHANEYHTVYAHLSRFGSGIRAGVRVSQGQIIGYVGSTGMSTGPHLHYEIHHRGRPVNPTKIDSMPGRTLAGEELQKFMAARKDLKTLFASLKSERKIGG